MLRDLAPAKLLRSGAPHVAERRCHRDGIARSTLEVDTVVSGGEEHDVRLKAIVHEAEEGGFWAEVPAVPGCATQGDTLEELIRNLHEAVEGCLSVDVTEVTIADGDRVIDIAV